MDKTYNPSSFEKEIYQNWMEKGYFHAKVDRTKKPFTIMMPPPNITGQLHMGHALDDTIQDVIIRFKRLQGYCALWLPGQDHASIATEVKIVDKLREEGTSKEEIGREEFLKRAWEWKEKYGGTISLQLRSLGCSCDWEREAFTLDEKRSVAVNRVFKDLYNKGLIFQGKRIINWCPDCKTALSDAEVEYEEKPSHLWHIRYPFVDGSGEIIVATTRPETILGDTAVAVNPQDERYQNVIGKKLILPLCKREIPVIADEYVEKEFGSGAVKITPAHDPNDFEVGLRHHLEVIRVMNDDASMNELAGEYCGLDRDTAREKIVQDLKAQGYMVKIEDYTHNVGTCYRCKKVVEPIVSKQWFVKMKPLAEPAVEAVKNEKIEFVPSRFSKIYYNWMENIKDWCISRQLWWGHRIPVYYCECGESIVSEQKITKCPKCGSHSVKQDEDVLDTWFSSALWPFSTLGYPEKTEDLEYFYPTNVLVTAYDIIFFWVARMIFSGIEHMQEVPFKQVLIHGLVRDEKGRKMSKSLGNGVDPLELIDAYGADSLRFSLSMGVAPGSDTRFIASKLESCRNFMNKIWNASRYVMQNLTSPLSENPVLDETDEWILHRLHVVTKEVTENLEKYELGLAASKLYDFVWSDYCDWYIELSKPVLYGNDEKKRSDKLSVLVKVLKKTLVLLHPFVPFITEKIYTSLPDVKDSIMLESWEELQDDIFRTRAKEFDLIIEVIREIRNVRAEKNVQPSKQIVANVVNASDGLKRSALYVEKLTNTKLHFDAQSCEDSVSLLTKSGEIYIALGELVDLQKEKERLEKELKNVTAEIERVDKLLCNQGFIGKAPQALVDKERKKREEYSIMKAKIEQQMAQLAKK